MATRVVRTSVPEREHPIPRRRWLADLAIRPETMAWWAVSLLLLILLGAWQARLRSPLSWDEAGLVDSGETFAFAVRSGSPGNLRDWVNTQTGYPSLVPALHGVARLVTGSTATAAWVPAALAYVLSGVLAGRLVRSLGAGVLAAWGAALVIWTTPINFRLAAGAFTENFGACALVGLLVVLTRLERTRAMSDALAAGGVVAAAWSIKYEYGFVALSVVSVAGLASLFANRDRRTFRLYAVAGMVAVVPVALLFFTANSAAIFRDAVTFIHQPGVRRQVDFLFYLRTLFDPERFDLAEVGLSSVVAALLILGLAWALRGWCRRPEIRVPVLAVVIWVVVYSFATAKQQRLVALIIPVLAALAAVGIADAGARRSEWGRVGRLGLGVLALVALATSDRSLVYRLVPLLAVLGVIATSEVAPARFGSRWRGAVFGLGAVACASIAPQVGSQLSSLREQLWFVKPNPVASQALDYVSQHLPPSQRRPVLMIGATSAFSPRTVQLAWNERLGEGSPGVHIVPEATSAQRRDALLYAIRQLRPPVIVSVKVGPGSRLGPDRAATGEELYPSQADYARIAFDLAGEGLLAPISTLALESDPVRIDIWSVRPAALTGLLRVLTEPSLPAAISVDGVPRDTYGLWTDLALGDHRVCFGALADHEAPPCQTVTLVAGKTTTIVGDYAARPGAPPGTAEGGLLSVITDPAVASQIVVDGVPRDTGSVHQLRVAPGTHQICFRYVPGYMTPPCQDALVGDGASVVAKARFAKNALPVKRG